MSTTDAHGVTRAETWRAPRMFPLTYPGAAPDHHYLLLGDEVHPVTIDDGEVARARLADGRSVDDVLASLGLPTLVERVPVLAYGANRNPHTLALKFVHHDYESGGSATAVPVLTGTVPDVDVVAAGLSSQGCLYADLTPSPGTTVHVHLTLLDVDQARAIHESEGVGWNVYDCARVPGFRIDGTDTTIEPLAYAGCHPVYLPPGTDQPIAFADIPAQHRRFRALGQLDALTELITGAGLGDELRSLLGLQDGDDHNDRAVALEASRALSGSWWYAHNTGDEPTVASRRIQLALWGALRQSCAATSTSQHYAVDDRIVEPAVAFASGPELRLGAQLD